MDLLSVGHKFGSMIFKLIGEEAGTEEFRQQSVIYSHYSACNSFINFASTKLTPKHKIRVKRLHRNDSPQTVCITQEPNIQRIVPLRARNPCGESSDLQTISVNKSITRKFGPRRNAQGYNYAAQLCFMKDECFASCVGVSRSTFEDLMTRISEVTRDTSARRSQEICLRIRLLMTIIYLTSKKVYKDLHNLFGYCEANICRLVCRTINDINLLSTNAIKWPISPESTADEFYEVHQFPGVLGAIDAMHLVSRAPEKMHDEYRNSRGKYTIILLAICDAQKKFTYVSVGYPGTFTDQKCLESTDLGSNLDNIPNDYFPLDKYHLIGSENFQLRDGLMVPFKAHEVNNDQNLDFNERLLKTQSITPSTFVEMRSRFQTLNKLEMSIERVVEFTTACCILHNVCLDNNDHWAGPLITNEDATSLNHPEPEIVAAPASALAKRARLVDQMCQALDS
ncbi:putative nuclease HARBI1 isoform X2 [Hyalella azteca]|uniref:Nuclease HARBI1 isoform X2 n=1 Tax=Hyalella azteca TaxID=294128 RepID=A0A8B7NE33_HYAAZ|nr:putative nuclease HARBI1 isoform X2 [Hyalella azteca]